MKKAVMALVLALLLALALSGCGEDKGSANRPGSDNNNTTDSGGNNAPDDAGGAIDDGVTDSNGAARNGMGRSTFGGAGRELQEDAGQFPPTVYDTMTGQRGASGTATWRQMLDNGFVHDTDGFLLDGENACWS